MTKLWAGDDRYVSNLSKHTVVSKGKKYERYRATIPSVVHRAMGLNEQSCLVFEAIDEDASEFRVTISRTPVQIGEDHLTPAARRARAYRRARKAATIISASDDRHASEGQETVVPQRTEAFEDLFETLKASIKSVKPARRLK